MALRARLRATAFGLATLTGLSRRGVFIPCRHAPAPRREGYAALVPVFEAAEPAMRAVLSGIEACGPDLARIADGSGPARFDQDWFPRLDAAAAYALVRRERPRRIVEIGSGHSTRFLARAVEDGALPTRILCIDPRPRASLEGLAGVRHRRALFDGMPEGLGAGDILFVDSSHVAHPGSDVDRLLLDVLPGLPGGVLVHVHDVFLPDAYPAHWAWRGYNEQVAVGALLQGGAYEILFASRYVVARRPDLLAGTAIARMPLREGALESSLWLRKRAPPA